jgi:hypothetical protein
VNGSASRGRRRGVSEVAGDGEVVVEEAGGDRIEARFVQAGRDGTGRALPLFEQRDRSIDSGVTGAEEGNGLGDPAVETVLSPASWGRLDREPEGTARKAAQQLAAKHGDLHEPVPLPRR